MFLSILVIRNWNRQLTLNLSLLPNLETNQFLADRDIYNAGSQVKKNVHSHISYNLKILLLLDLLFSLTIEAIFDAPLQYMGLTWPVSRHLYQKLLNS